MCLNKEREDGIRLVPLTAADRENFRRMKVSPEQAGTVFDTYIVPVLWKDLMSDDRRVFTVRPASGSDVYGFVQIQNIKSDHPEIGIEISNEYRNKGYGLMACRKLIDHVFDFFHFHSVYWEAETDNEASLHMAERLGGIRILDKPEIDPGATRAAIEAGVMTPEEVKYTAVFEIINHRH